MTDNEITKALNEADGLYHVSIYCADRKGNHIASVRVIDIVDLINRLQAKNEALIAGQETLQKALAEKSKEIQVLRNTVVCDISNFASEYDSKIKSEAIKEFADKLKGLLLSNIHVSNEEYYYMTIYIDNLVKEMVGDAKNATTTEEE